MRERELTGREGKGKEMERVGDVRECRERKVNVKGREVRYTGSDGWERMKNMKGKGRKGLGDRKGRGKDRKGREYEGERKGMGKERRGKGKEGERKSKGKG